jgi:hypothetical protein
MACVSVVALALIAQEQAAFSAPLFADADQRPEE